MRQRHEASSGGSRPAFLITVDAEGDDLWSRPRRVTTRNAEYLPRFQSLCERFGMKPSYLTTFEMARSPAYREFARDVVRRGQGEVGMHLHAWSSPPLVPLTPDDARCQPYLTEYPETVMRAKIRCLTEVLEETFQTPILSHRGGRWGFDRRYARLLIEHGYRVDSSVTPHVSWESMPGDPQGSGGPDYRGFPDRPYFLDLDDLSRPGSSVLLEVPMTTQRIEMETGSGFRGTAVPHLVRWLRPNGRNRDTLLRLTSEALARGRSCVVLMLHSSELMPGGSPILPGAEEIDSLYRDLEILLEECRSSFRGSTLGEFRNSLGSALTSSVAAPRDDSSC